MVTIGEATATEREWCAALMARSEPWVTLGRGVERCRALMQNPAYRISIARQEGKPLGFLLLHPSGLAGSPYIASIAVAAEHRGHGIGSRLLQAVETAQTSRFLFLCVSNFNTRARALYERHGFQQVGELPDYIVDGASEILMAKRLR